MSRRHNGEPRNGSNSSFSPPSAPSPSPFSNHFSGIPFRDAEPNTNELPLDSVDCFIVPANDESGHSERTDFRLSPYLKRTMKLLVHSGRFPYLDVQDLIRHAINRHCSWLIGLRYSLPKHPRVALAAMEEICKDAEWQIKSEEVFGRIMELVTYYMSRGDMTDAMRLVSVLKARLTSAEHNGRTREFVEKFNRSFGHHLQPGGLLNPADKPVTVEHVRLLGGPDQVEGVVVGSKTVQ
jgi:hypothetical protein